MDRPEINDRSSTMRRLRGSDIGQADGRSAARYRLPIYPACIKQNFTRVLPPQRCNGGPKWRDNYPMGPTPGLLSCLLQIDYEANN